MLEAPRVWREMEEIFVLPHCPLPALRHLQGLTLLPKLMTFYFVVFGGSEPSHGVWVTLPRGFLDFVDVGYISDLLFKIILKLLI